MNKLYVALMLATCSMSQYVVAAPSADAAPKKIESCTQEEEKTQAGMNKIFGSIRSPRYVDSAGKPVQPKLPRRCPPSKAEQDAAMRTIYGNIRSPAYVKGAQTK